MVFQTCICVYIGNTPFCVSNKCTLWLFIFLMYINVGLIIAYGIQMHKYICLYRKHSLPCSIQVCWNYILSNWTSMVRYVRTIDTIVVTVEVSTWKKSMAVKVGSFSPMWTRFRSLSLVCLVKFVLGIKEYSTIKAILEVLFS